MKLEDSASVPPQAPARRSRSTGVVVPHQPKLAQRLAATTVFLSERLVTCSLRLAWRDDFGACQIPPPVIFCVWHNRLALSMALYRWGPCLAHPGRHMAAIVSASKDGAFLAAVLERFGVQPVRGSSSRRGPQALLELTSWAERGYDLAITPDGPRGPRYVVQEGAIALAQLTGLPLIPVSYSAARKFTLKSWDGFQLPWPFSKCQAVFSEPMWIARQITDAEKNEARLELERRLRNAAED